MLALPAVLNGQSAPPEMRAVWISRFEWPGGTANQMRERIDTMMANLRANNFNAVLFQIRGQADVLYPSPYEPWSNQFNWTDPGWDPLAYAINSARQNGLEFHAYINTHTMRQIAPPAVTVPQHLYNLHGPNAAEPWVIHGTDGQPVDYVDSYTWISPGIPAAEAWTRRAVLHVLENYDVDGLHFDRIRTPGPGYSYDPITVARFNGAGNPNNLDWGDFMRAQITEQLRRLYGASMLRKPHVKMSAAPFGIVRREPGGYQGTGTESEFQWYQDSFRWMEGRVLDCLFPQIYWDIGSAHPFEVLLADFLRYDGGRHIYPGLVTSRNYIAQVYETRNQGALGTTVFSYNTVDFGLYLNGPFTEPAPVPVMPWKEQPTHAIVVGHVIDPDGQPVQDAHVQRIGASWIHTSSFDGFYAINEIEPGTQTITATVPGLGTLSRTLTLAAGEVVEVDFRFSVSAGKIEFDKAVYTLTESPLLRLTDADLGVDAIPQVRIFGTREATPEVITLNAVEPSIFEATLELQYHRPVTGDGFLQVGPGTTIHAEYDDEFDGEGPSTASVSAAIEHLVIDNDTPGFSHSGGWLTSSFGNNYGANKRYIANNNPTALASWTFEGIDTAVYRADFWVNNNNYAADARYTIQSNPPAPLEATAFGNQRNVGDGWHFLGDFGLSGASTFELRGLWDGLGIYAVADALRIGFVSEMDASPEPSESARWTIY
jgi:uncharacterized lipoprotein YddW (UPF0748 family)